MLSAGRDELERARDSHDASSIPGARVIEASAKVGGGRSPCSSWRGRCARSIPRRSGSTSSPRRLRAGEPPVIGRAREGWLLLDPRTLTDEEAELAARRVADELG